jgi:sigma-B regulation protein RsbU (phosphoserine phosphatase)
MDSIVKSFFQNLSEVPNHKFQSDYKTPVFVRAIVFGNYAYFSGLFVHALLLVIFSLMGISILAYFNIFSVILWAIAILGHRRGYLWQGYYIITIEIIAHAAICTMAIGWDAGFQYYVLIQPAVVFLLPGKITKKIILTAIYTCAFAAMNIYANATIPQIELNTLYIALFNYGNIFSVCSVLAYIAYQYYRAAINAEKKLEKEHKKTNAALDERNKILERLNLELSEAAGYVRTILPQPITEGTIRTDWRFVPSTSLGGDAFGYHWVDEDHFAIYLIDVSGHGVGAALLSVSVMNVLRSQTLPGADFKKPEQILGALNIAFPGEENNDMFFTMWYGVYEKSTRELSYASGGHPPALLLDNSYTDDSKVMLLRTPNQVVGGMSNVTYKKKNCIISEHNTLYIFSDGVYEVEKSDGSMWRFQEFAETINKFKTEGQSILDRLYNYARKIGSSDKFEDDFTIIEVAFG